MKFNKRHILLIAIILLASFLRIWQLDQYPSGLNADEAAIGYNAYSLLQTGRDEHGEVFPIHFKSFGDYKPGLYFYIVLPFVKIMGLNIWAIRLPSAFLGIISVLGIMLLVKELLGEQKITNKYSLISGLFLAISPWHLQFSRGGWEVNAATTFLIFGCLFLFKGLTTPKNYLIAVIFFVISMYTYHSIRVIGPLLGGFFFILYFTKIKQQLKYLISSGLLGFVVLLPLLLSFLSPAGASRFTGVSFLSQSGPEWRANELRGEHGDPNNIFVRLFHNRIVTYGLNLTQNYLDHFNGNFLFITGDVIQRNRVPETGQMYIYDALFLIIGLWATIKTLSNPKIFLLFWLLIAPVAAAMTFQTPHALRSHNMVIPLIVLSTFGFIYLIDWINKRRNFFAALLYCYIIILLTWNTTRYLHEYYIHYPQIYPAAWEYGFKDLVDYLKPIAKNYDKIYITDKYDQPYILFLFYLQYPPTQFQKEVILTPRDKFNFSTVRDFANYYFEAIDWNSLKNEKNTLVVGTDEEIPKDANIIKTINFPNGKPAFKIAQL